MDKLLENKNILVTGASGGIGRSTSVTLASYGANLILAGRNIDNLTRTSEEIKKIGRNSTCIPTDITSQAEVNNLFTTIDKTFEKLDGAFNNSGFIERPTSVHELEDEVFFEVMRTNVYGTWICMKKEIELMIKQNKGSIVNCSSINGLKGNPRHPVYSATKHAILGLTKSASIDYAKHNIRINAVAPGPVETPMMKRVDKSNKHKKETIKNWIPLGRYAEPKEIADTVAWMLSDHATYMTGSTLSIDGGLSAS